MLEVGDLVRILPPFSDTFDGTYVIVSVQSEGGSTAYFVGGIEGGFDASYLELAE